MQTKFTYIEADTGKNLFYKIMRITDLKGRLLRYEVIESYRKQNAKNSKWESDHIKVYITDLKQYL